MEVIKILDRINEDLLGKNTVLLLSSRDVSEYDRGIIQGRLDMISKIKIELEKSMKNEDSSVRR